jgi:ubiquinone/menaquinone biosynthesis C-methylase UbiE
MQTVREPVRDMPACIQCGSKLKPFRSQVRDWEYGVVWNSTLASCESCGLVTHDPPIRAEQIDALYPSNYLAHTPASNSSSLYGRVKALIGSSTARRVARHIPAGGSCIEVGCGNGAFLKILSEVRGDVELAGVDIRDLGLGDIPGVTFHDGQLEDIDFSGKRFDAVYCSNLIEHVPDPFRFLSKCAEILKPGGVIYGITPDHLSIDRYLFGRYWAGYHYPRHTYVFDHKNIVQILERCGFVDVRVKGSYSFWSLSIANRFVQLPGTKKRGVLFAAIAALFLPLDVLINLFRCHGSMSFVARAQAKV